MERLQETINRLEARLASLEYGLKCEPNVCRKLTINEAKQLFGTNTDRHQRQYYFEANVRYWWDTVTNKYCPNCTRFDPEAKVAYEVRSHG